MTPLFLGKWCGVATFFFFIQKNKKKLNTTLHEQIVSLSLIEKKKNTNLID